MKPKLMIAVCLLLPSVYAQLPEFTETGPGSVGTLRTKLNATIRQTNTNSWNVATNALELLARPTFEQATNIAQNVAGPGGGGVTNHADLLNLDADDHAQYLNTTRGDARYVLPAAMSASNAVQDVLIAANALDIATNTAALAARPTFEQATNIAQNVAGPGGGGVTNHADLLNLDADDHAQYLNTTRGDARYVQPRVDAEFLTLDREISAWQDIGITFSNAVTLNAAVTITNDSAWTGWTTDGTLSAGTIFLEPGEYLLSPVQTNGIAYVDAEIWSHQNGTASSTGIYTNGVLAQSTAPWRYNNGQWRIEAGGTLPGGTPGLHVESVRFEGYEDIGEAANAKQVSNLSIIDDPVNPTDAANYRFVVQERDAAKAYADAELAAHDADAEKTVRGAQLRLGNMWVVSPADTSGERFIVSGGEIAGDGELVGTTNEFIISKNDYPLLTFTSGASGVYITNSAVSLIGGTNVQVSLYVAANGVSSAPYAEWAADLGVGEWTRITAYDAQTYPTVSGGSYTLQFTLPVAAKMYFRALQEQGSSVMTLNVDVMDANAKALVNVGTLGFASGLSVGGAVDPVWLGAGSTNEATYMAALANFVQTLGGGAGLWVSNGDGTISPTGEGSESFWTDNGDGTITPTL